MARERLALGRRWTRGIAVALLFAGATPAEAINIILNYDPTQSDSAPPATDPNGTQLTALMQYAETFYEDVFEDSHTITLNFWWAQLSGGNVGLHNPVSFSGGRQTEANIRLDPSPNWFFDPTPADDAEFTMTQTLWRDLTSTQRLNDFNNFGGGVNQVPDTFEAGFTGNAINGGAADNRRDALSTVLHEVGHALGMSAGNPATIAQTADGDYDFDPDFILGQSLSAETADNSPGDNANIAHLARPTALMDPGRPAGVRARPSHIDLFSMASGHSYVSVDVPRREFYGDAVGDGVGSWNTNAHWSGNQDPSGNDDVFVRAAQGTGTTITAFLSTNGFARSLTLSEGANIDTNGFKLDVGGDVTITGVDTDLFINPGGEFEADEVFIQDQAEIESNGGLVDVRRLTIDADAQLEAVSGGALTVDVSQRLINHGTIDVDNNATITFVSTATNTWDLDGDGDGRVFANDGDLIFDTGGMAGDFSGEVTVGPGHVFRFDAPWTLGVNGTIDLNGGATTAQAARISGGTIDMAGISRIEADGQARIDPNVNLSFATDIVLGADADLVFNGAVFADGSDYTLPSGSNVLFNGTTTVTGIPFVTTQFSVLGSGPAQIDFNAFTLYSNADLRKSGGEELQIQQTGDARYVGTNEVTADVYDLDGNNGNNTLFFGDGVNAGLLVLNVDAIDTTNNIFNGTLDLSNPGLFGGLIVNLNEPTTRWRMAGTIELGGNPLLHLDRIAGTRFEITGTVNVTNQAGIAADVDLLDTAVINYTSPASRLGVRGFTQVTAGADFVGAGGLDALIGGELLLADGADLADVEVSNRGFLSIQGTGGSVGVAGFRQDDVGTWRVDLAGSNSLLYDGFATDGAVQLAGALALNLAGGYVPNLYTTTHTIINGIFFATRTGVFDTVDGVVQDGFGLAVLYNAQDVFVRAALLGDANLNGIVEQGDLNAVLNNWGQSNLNGNSDMVSWVTGDLNGNGLVEQGDLNQVLANWGDATTPDFSGFSVPEPTAALALLGSVVAAWRRRCACRARSSRQATASE